LSEIIANAPDYVQLKPTKRSELPSSPAQLRIIQPST
jgi:hypothetical protein